MAYFGYFALLGLICLASAQRENEVDRNSNEVVGNIKYREFFFDSVSRMHLPKGRVVARNINETNCLRECLDSATCFAVDYDERTRTCYDHSQSTYCEELVPADDRRHYRRLPCLGEKEGASSLYQYTRVMGITDDEAPACIECGIDMCLEMCADDENCQALDYSFSDRVCHLHHRSVFCSEQNRTGDPNHLHAQKDPCKLELIVDEAEEAVEDGMGITVLPLTNRGLFGEQPLPGMVARMANLRVGGGSLVIRNVSEERCARICTRAHLNSCQAVDYDTWTNECILLNNRTACRDLSPSERFNHHRRAGCPGGIRVDHCMMAECNSGRCVNHRMDFQCVCDQGFSGRNCEINEDDCSPNPCTNGGQCVDGANSFTCDCLDGFTGARCENNINECASDPCQNGGTCMDMLNSFICRCADGYAGTQCETDIDDCLENECENEGTCIDEVDGYSCVCAEQYNGTLCEDVIDACGLLEPCENGATCTNLVNDFRCQCRTGYTGDNCSININECEDDPCNGRGICLDMVGRFFCVCNAGYNGLGCENDIDDCSTNPCLNEGVCTDGVDSFSCACNPGFTGETCATDIDECSSPNPCQNAGTCTDEVNSYTCACVEGYNGTDCENDVDDCADSPCINGECTDMVAAYVCDCNPGFQGTNCDADIDECESSPCQNGATCNNDHNAYRCECLPGYAGVNCEEDTDECRSDPCTNNATCVDLENAYRCDCQAGYTGPTCDTEINECTVSGNPCQNGAQCIDLINSFVCACQLGFSGPTCAINQDDCESTPCLNNGTCTDLVRNFRCSCIAGFQGRTCEINRDDCATNPCLNGGTCVDAVNAFMCTCATGWEGPNCELNVDDCASVPCSNGGSCIDGVNEFICDCSTAPGYGGLTCTDNVDDCIPEPCLNGGTCSDLINDYTCSCPDGFVGKNCSGSELLAWPQMCLAGGTQRGPGRNITECLSICQNDAQCLAVDYDTRDGDCLVHKGESACNRRMTCEGKVHYQMGPCVDEFAPRSRGATSFIRTRISGVYVAGGEAVDCASCTRDECLQACGNRTDCVAIDYYHAAAEGSTVRCNLHSSATACNALVPDSVASHYTVRPPDHCVDQPTQATSEGFNELTFPGPTVIPPGWQAFPARQQLSGRALGVANMTGDACVDMCNADPNCHAFDFNTIDGSCFSYWTLERKCGNLLDNPEVYHMKKPGACTGPNQSLPARVGIIVN